MPVDEPAAVPVEYGRILPVPVALLPGVGVTLGGVVVFEAVGCTGRRLVVQDACGGAVTGDQYLPAGRMNRRALLEITRQVLFEQPQRDT
ncbi:hypothetical protein GON09_005665 [Rhodococcus sp. B50]|nr:hypothetical protein [Rhodococcus sp. B50]